MNTNPGNCSELEKKITNRGVQTVYFANSLHFCKIARVEEVLFYNTGPLHLPPRPPLKLLNFKETVARDFSALIDQCGQI
jgi:hypothetical protein